MDKNEILSKVFVWMFMGLLVTFLTGYVVSMNANMVMNIFSGFSYFLFVLLELGLVIYLSARISKMSPTTARICFLIYSFVTGLTFSSIFIAYELGSIMYVFLITAVLFGILAMIGRFTKINLMKFGTYLLVALIGILICSIINIFLQSDSFSLIISIVGIVIFLGYTAYDVQKVMVMYDNNSIVEENLAIYGALQLYLDFINLFLRLLRFLGNSRDN